MSEVTPLARTVIGVSELTRQIKLTLEDEVGYVWVEGEISNLSRPSSGHLYFDLKDENAQIRAAFFRGRQGRSPLDIRNGQRIRVHGQVSVFEKRGEYQLIVQQVEDAGKGALQEAFEALKQKLAEEGLFDAERKRRLPMLPERIGMITSPTGAVIRDMLHVLNRRYPDRHIQLIPVKVQGDGAAEEIAAAIDLFNELGQIDVLIVGRGGGSLEDLWAFNEEVVARAVARSRVPVISAVGHETDFTICDFIADVRAPTPSAAAEIVVRAKSEFQESMRNANRRLVRALDAFRLELKNRLITASQSYVFREPQNLVRGYRQDVQRVRVAMAHALRGAVRERQQRIDESQLHLRHQITAELRDQKNRLNAIQSQLKHLNPHGVLERGYSITKRADGRVITRATDVATGEALVTLLAEGHISSQVINPTSKEPT